MTAPTGKVVNNWNNWSYGTYFIETPYDAISTGIDKSTPWMIRRMAGEVNDVFNPRSAGDTGKLDKLINSGMVKPEAANRFQQSKLFEVLFDNKAVSKAVDPWTKQYQYVDDLMNKTLDASHSKANHMDILKQSRNGSGGAVNLNPGPVNAAAAMSYSQMFGLDRAANISERVASKYVPQVMKEAAASGKVLTSAQAGKEAVKFLTAADKIQVARETFGLKNMFTTANQNLMRGEAANSNVAKHFAKKVVVGQNVRNVVEPLSKGNVLFGGLMTFAWAMMAWTAVKAGRQEYSNSRAKGKGVISSALDGLWAFGKKAVRSLISWEIAGLGYALGTAALAVAFPAAAAAGGLLFTAGSIVGGITAGVGLAVAADKFILSKVLPDPLTQGQ